MLPRRRIIVADAGGGRAAGGARRVHLGGSQRSRSTTAWAWSACSLCSWRSAAPSPGRARRVPRPRRPELALAIGNLGAPGGLTRSVVLSLGRRPVAAGHRGAGRSLHRRRADRPPAGGKPQLLRARRQALRDRRLPCPRRSARRRRPGRARRRCCAAASSSSATARPSTSRRRRRRNGCSTAIAASPTPTTVPDGSSVVAGQWWPADYAGEPLVSVRGRDRQGLGPQDRRHRHGQRARPQRHGAHRQPARGEVGEPGAQLRAGFLAQHAAPARRTICWRPSPCRRTRRSPPRPSSPSRSAARSRPPPPSASRMPSTPSTPSSAA